MIQIIPSVFRLITNREVKLPPFSVTSTLPSIMNGGKDFSPWSKIDDLLYQTMRIPVEAVLGKDGVGLADCAIAESKFEKGEDISGSILLLVSQLGEVQKKGTPDIEFAIVGLLARSQIALGRAEDALRTVQMIRVVSGEGTKRSASFKCFKALSISYTGDGRACTRNARCSTFDTRTIGVIL